MKRRMFVLSLIMSMVCGTFNVEAHSINHMDVSETSYVESVYGHATKLFEIAYGDDETELGRTEFVVDCVKVSPKSFTVDEERNFYILDTLNDMVKVYSETGAFVKAIPFSEQLYGLDIEKVNGNIYIYADDCSLYKIDESNPDDIEVVTSIDRVNIAGLYSVDNELFVRSYNGSDMKITISDEHSMKRSNGASCVIADDDTVIGLRNSADVKLLNTDQDVTYGLSCVLEPAGAYCIKKENNVIYTLSNETDWSYTETRISKIQDESILKSALAISREVYEYGIPFKKVYIQEDVIYQMVPQENAVAIYVIPWSAAKETRITDTMIEAYHAKDIEVSPAFDVAVSRASFSVTREEAMERAYLMCYKAWDYDPTTMHTPTTDNTKSPQHLGTTATNTVGIPYCWGGMNGLDTASYAESSLTYMENFSDCLTSGKTAGNINCTSGSYVDGTFGIDCSGFICAALKIKTKVGTSRLADWFDSTEWDVAQSGDVVIWPGSHTFMIKHIYSSDSSGIYMISTYESTIDSSSARAMIMHWEFADISDSYKVYTYQ